MENIIKLIDNPLKTTSLNPCESCGSDKYGYKPCDYGYHCSKVNSTYMLSERRDEYVPTKLCY